jgi:GAF domain-containing protein
MAVQWLYDGAVVHRVAQRGFTAALAKWIIEEGNKYPPHFGGLISQILTEKRPIHILDRRELDDYRSGHPPTVAVVDQGGVRTTLLVPMLKEGRVIGAIFINRPEVRAFTQKQIDLVSTFANQAVIAIENVRLFKELQARNADVTEALEQQTATAEILKVISSSPTDIQPVFDAIPEKAIRLCDAHTGKRIRMSRSAGPAPNTLNFLAKGERLDSLRKGALHA